MTSPRSGADAPAARFSTAELDYLLAERRLGRLATIDASGQPHVVPLGWSYNPELGTIDISGRRFAGTRKFRNVAANPRVAFIVDDVAPPWQPCAVMVEGRGHALSAPAAAGTEAMIRITPEKIVSWGLDGAPPPRSD
jgi:PPOX class F420-dependent enzyme/OxyR family protein